ncbi:hypothetical protein MPER_06432, partial [Moniliophthora perniciosa FA553]
TVHGGSNELRASNCTSCRVLEHAGAPKLYLLDPKTQKFEAVKNNVVNYHNRGNLDKANGGPGLKAFPPGFKMASGTPTLRSKKNTFGSGTQAELAERAISWECLRTKESSLISRSLDNSTDHKGHVAFLSDLDKGDCPCTHPVGFMQIEYVISWDVHCFADRWNESDGWPFVYATGGWDVDILQKAIDTCDNSCKLSPAVKEDVHGPFAKLPGYLYTPDLDADRYHRWS